MSLDDGVFPATVGGSLLFLTSLFARAHYEFYKCQKALDRLDEAIGSNQDSFLKFYDKCGDYAVMGFGLGSTLFLGSVGVWCLYKAIRQD